MSFIYFFRVRFLVFGSVIICVSEGAYFFTFGFEEFSFITYAIFRVFLSIFELLRVNLTGFTIGESESECYKSDMLIFFIVYP